MVGSYPESPPGEAHEHISTKTGSDIPQQLPHRCPEGSGCQPKIVSGKYTAEALVKMMWEWPLQLPRDPTYPGTIRISETGEFRIVHGVSSGPSLEDMAKDRKVRVGTMYLLEALRTVLGYRLLWNRQQPWENCATESCDQQAWYIISRFNEFQRLGEESDPEIELNILLKVFTMRNFSTDNLLSQDEALNVQWVLEAKKWLLDREESGACFCFE